MRTAAALLAGLLVVGCAGSNQESGPDAPALRSESDLAASMQVTVGSAAVQLGLHVTNHGSEPISFTFPSSQRYDFRVSDGSGETVWTWSATRSFLQAITEATLRPGETWDFRAEWEPEGRSGTYVATGWVTARDLEVVQTSTFEVP